MPCNLFGPNDNYDLKNSHFLPALIRKISAASKKNKIVRLWGTGRPLREILYVDEVAEACEYFLKKTNPFDHIQAIIVRGNLIFKETSKGTKNLIKKINKIKVKRGVLIKYPKKKQDMRVDLPTIGLDTLKDCKKAGLKGVILKNKQNIFLEKKKCINFANKNKIFILVK